MDVISFPEWRVWFFRDESGRNAILNWLYREGIPAEVISDLQGKIDFVEAGGPGMIPGCIESVKGGGDLHVLKIERVGFRAIRIIFCFGPTGDRELTLLAGAPDKALEFRNVSDALESAKKRQQVLSADRTRRCYERINKKPTVRV